MIYLISYELKTNNSYSDFYEAIKSYGLWWHYLDKVWLVKTTDTPKQIYEKLQPHLDESDHIFVAEVNVQSGKYFGLLNKKAWEWIKKNS